MTKLLHSLGIALVLATTLAGCELYFGEDDNNDNWSYCGSDGQYNCRGNDCQWVSAECTDGGGGFTCDSDEDCAAGCYCDDNGVCEEAGFCDSDDDCSEGYHCDDRSSCVPDTCDEDTDCLAGQHCDNGECTTTCTCENDQQAQDGGYGWCDETRGTCMPGTDPAGSCAGQVTCPTAPPRCGLGTVPVIKDGCYTGECRSIAACDAAPACPSFQHEDDCLAADSCGGVYVGRNCRKPDGTACQAGDTNCVCERFDFNSCEADNDALQNKWFRTSTGLSPL
ncbi:MAG: hypothetical protein WKG01_31615 [Kofleriaceae bacterium]